MLDNNQLIRKIDEEKNCSFANDRKRFGTNMKWILIVIVLSFEKVSGDSSFKNDENSRNDNSLPLTISNKSLRRVARTLGFDSKETDDGVHLHIWNDMNNKDNYYPNLFRMNEAQPQQTTNSPIISSDSNSIHINMDNVMSPSPMQQLSPHTALKNALINSIDDFRKSDRDLYEALYKLNTNQNKNQMAWNYYPSVANYIPKTYATNLNTISPPISSLQSISPMLHSQIFTRPIVVAASALRPSLLEQMHSTRHLIQNYYTNLGRARPKSVLDAVGYEIGGIPRYSGRLMANEPTPQRYQSFQMYEPLPRQVMMPPPITRIPQFKPVPPRLKIIPVVEEYLENQSNYINHYNHRAQAWKMLQNYRYPVAPPVKLIPFNMNEAITKMPIQPFIPATELYRQPSTEPYQFYRPTTASPTPAPTINTFTYPSVVYAQPSSQNSNSFHYNDDGAPPNAAHDNEIAPNSIVNEFDLATYTFKHDPTKIPKSNATSAKKTVSVEESRPTFHDNEVAHQKQHQQPQQIPQTNAGNEIFNYTNKNAHKKLNSTRKLLHSNNDTVKNDVVKLNITGFRVADNASDDSNSVKPNRRKSGKGKIGSNSPTNDSAKKAKDVTLSYGDLTSDALEEQPVGSVSSDSIQLSTTYSKQTSNIRRPTSRVNEMLKNHVFDSHSQNKLLTQLTNDVSKALSTSQKSNRADDDQRYMESSEIEKKAEEPFLITVFAENESVKNNMQNDLAENGQHSDVDRSDSFASSAHENHQTSNSLVQRIDYDSEWNNAEEATDAHKHHNHSLHTESEMVTVHANNSETSQLTAIDRSNNKSNSTQVNQNNSASKETANEKYLKWFNGYAAEKNQKHGRPVISEHFKRVEIEPNIAWVIVPK